MKSKDQILLEEAYQQVSESSEDIFRDYQGKTLKDYFAEGDGTKENPFIPKSWSNLYIVAGFLRDLSNANNKKVYYYRFNNVDYLANGENKLIKAS